MESGVWRGKCSHGTGGDHSTAEKCGKHEILRCSDDMTTGTTCSGTSRYDETFSTCLAMTTDRHTAVGFTNGFCPAIELENDLS
jgi:hypothetical protein